MYRALLVLYPREFRRDFTSQLMATFSSLARDTYRARGLRPFLILQVRAVIDIVKTAVREHGMNLFGARRPSRHRPPKSRRLASGHRVMESIFQDVRYAVRTLVKRPGFALVVVLTLALGIGANTAIFSVINSVLLQALPYGEDHQLVHLRQPLQLEDVESIGFSAQEIEDYREQSRTLEGVVEYHTLIFGLIGRGQPLRVRSGIVSANFFDVLGVKPLLGRTFLLGEDEIGADYVLVLSHGFWMRSFGGDSSVVGQTVEMNDRVYTIVGVLPPVALYPDGDEVYMPVSSCPFRSSSRWIENRNVRAMRAFGRLRAGVTMEVLQTDLASIGDRLHREHPDAYPETRGFATTAVPLREELVRDARPVFMILLGTAGLVLLIASANVANLTFARLVGRDRELAVRAALGAGRGRLLRQLLTESMLLALAGGAVGLVLAVGVLDLLAAFAAQFTPRAGEIAIDRWVLLFTLTISVITGLAAGSVPAFPSLQEFGAALKEGNARTTASAGKHRLQGAMVVAQIAVSFALLIGAGLTTRSLIKLQGVDPGFTAANVLSMTVATDDFNPNMEQRKQFYRELLGRLDAHPAVESAAATMTYPFDGRGQMDVNFQIEDRPIPEGQRRPEADIRIVSNDYFRTMGIPIVAGRGFTDADHEGSTNVAVINEHMARGYFGDESPLGKKVSWNRGNTWLTIVGVVGDVRQYGLDSEIEDEIYQPIQQLFMMVTSVVVRTQGDPTALTKEVVDVIHELEPHQAVADVQTMEQRRSRTLSSPRLVTILLSIFAGLALVITSAGIGGVLAFSVSQRTSEIGLRMALGADGRKVLLTVLRQGMTLVVGGLALGVVSAVALTRFVSSLLFQIEATDPLTFATVFVTLVAVATAACLIPARRATTIDPMTALRSE
jgi:predicted permease